MTTLRESSKSSWNGSGSIEHINAGSLQRIADAVETMSGSYADLIHERDLYARQSNWNFERADRLVRSNAALRGVITKLKKRLKEPKA